MTRLHLSLIVVVLAAFGATPVQAKPHHHAKVDDSDSSRALGNVPRPAGEKPVVAIFDVTSEVPEIQPRAAKEMFVTALIKSGAFTVVERTKLDDGVAKERQLTGGATGSSTLTAAQYVFEVAITEANDSEDQGNHSLSVAGAEIDGSHSTAQIGMDIRITDVSTGVVVDSVDVTHQIEATQTQVSGVGNLLNTVLTMKGGRGLPVAADATVSSAHNEGFDRALRSCIETGVATLAQRFGKTQQ
jgi:curli biogenesis system outer membrane secretion channel CsgG